MITLRKSEQRGSADHGWLQTTHSFSFADFYDPTLTHFSDLLVINEDRIAPGKGFGQHGHRDIEIVSYVLEGELAHRDTLGNIKTIPPGDVQRMSAGTGIQHSEFNHSTVNTAHFLQIWIRPTVPGIQPGYEQKSFPVEQKRGRLRLVLSPNGDQGSVSINADARLYAGLFDGEEGVTFEADASRDYYVHLVRGDLTVNGHKLSGGDAAMVREEGSIVLSSPRDAEVLVFDMQRQH